MQPHLDGCPTCGQPARAAERQVREAIRQALNESELTQSELAEQVGMSQKHISQVLSGKSGLSFDLAEQMLAVLGRRLDASVTSGPARTAPDGG